MTCITKIINIILEFYLFQIASGHMNPLFAISILDFPKESVCNLIISTIYFIRLFEEPSFSSQFNIWKLLFRRFNKFIWIQIIWQGRDFWNIDYNDRILFVNFDWSSKKDGKPWRGLVIQIPVFEKEMALRCLFFLLKRKDGSISRHRPCCT